MGRLWTAIAVMILCFLTPPAVADLAVSTPDLKAGEDSYLPRASRGTERSTFAISVSPGPNTEFVYFTLSPSRIPGVCCNEDVPKDDRQYDFDFNFVLSDQDQDLVRRGYLTIRSRIGTQPWGHFLRVDAGTMRRDKYIPPDGEVLGQQSGFTVRVTSFDYGGRCVVLVYENSPEGSLAAPPIHAPHDSDADLLPDAWELRNKVAGSLTKLNAESDDDEWPEQENKARTDRRFKPHRGDGITAFEEYRGFVINARHFRLDEATGAFGGHGGPRTIDLFLHDVKQKKLLQFINEEGPENLAGVRLHPAFYDMGAVFHRVNDEEAKLEDLSSNQVAELKDVQATPDQASGLINHYMLDRQRASLRGDRDLGGGREFVTSKGARYAVRVLFNINLGENKYGTTQLDVAWHSFMPQPINNSGLASSIAEGGYTRSAAADEILKRAVSSTVAHELGHRLGLQPVPTEVAVREARWPDKARQLQGHPISRNQVLQPPIRTFEFLGLDILPRAARLIYDPNTDRVGGIGVVLQYELGTKQATLLEVAAFATFHGSHAAVPRIPPPALEVWSLLQTNQSKEDAKGPTRARVRTLQESPELDRHESGRQPRRAPHHDPFQWLVYLHVFHHTDTVMDAIVFFQSEHQWRRWHQDSYLAMRVLR